MATYSKALIRDVRLEHAEHRFLDAYDLEPLINHWRLEAGRLRALADTPPSIEKLRQARCVSRITHTDASTERAIEQNILELHAAYRARYAVEAAVAFSELGRIYLAQRDHLSAREALAEAIRLNPAISEYRTLYLVAQKQVDNGA